MRPKELIKEWVIAFNKADVDKIAECYHEDAINHQVANKPVKGKKAISKMFADEFAANILLIAF